MLYITGLQIEPNPVSIKKEIFIEVEIQEVFDSAKNYKGKYPYRYKGNMAPEGHKYPSKYPHK